MINKLIYCIALFFIFSFIQTSYAAIQLKTQLDRDTINMGETVNLIIRIDDEKNNVTPNLEPLTRDFTIISQAQQQQISIINGNSSAVLLWYIGLAPKRTGTLTIPSLQIGHAKTLPLSVKVVSENERTSQVAVKDIFMRTKLNPTDVYVQSQAIYTIQLFYNRNIQNPSLTDPVIEDGNLIQIGKDKSYQKTVDKEPYQVIERRYAIIPQKSGNLTIEAPILTGNIIDREQISQNMIQFFNSMVKPIRVTTHSSTLHAKPIPQGFSNKNWLPAKSLTLEEEWSDSKKPFTVGQPITRTLTLKAEGVSAEQLPELMTTPSHSQLQIYPDKPILDTANNSQGILAIRIEKIAIIPTQQGKIELPAIDVKWWDTKNNKPQVASIPARFIDIAPAVINQAEAKNGNTTTTSTNIAALNQQTPTTLPRENSTEHSTWLNVAKKLLQKSSIIWMIISSTLFVAWISTFYAWRKAKKQNYTANISSKVIIKKSIEKAKQKCKAACHKHDASACKTSLLEWAHLQWPDQSFTNLGDIESRMALSETKNALRELDKFLYRESKAEWQGKNLWVLLEKEMTSIKKNKPSKEQRLPSLYP